MGYYEAVEDGIPLEKEGYLPPCHICGASVFSLSYRRNLKYTCPDCKKYLVEAKLKENEVPKKEKRLSDAIKRIAKVSNIEAYENAITMVSKKLNTRGWFQSTEEIMVALELLKRNIKVLHQVKVYSYSVDFVLPDYKVALEIDGPLHQVTSKKAAEDMRDELIMNRLGSDYALIRISTENINMNVTKIVQAIDAVLARRNKKKRRKCP